MFHANTFQSFLQGNGNTANEDNDECSAMAAYVRADGMFACNSKLLGLEKIFVDADLDFVTMDPSQIQVLAGLQCSEEDRPKLQSAIYEKMTAWLASLPGSVRKNVEEKVLVTSWRSEHFFNTVVEFFQPTPPTQLTQPTTPPPLLQSSASANFESPEKRSRTTAGFSEYTGVSPAKTQRMEADNVESKFRPDAVAKGLQEFTPLDKLGTYYKIRHNVLGKVLMVGKIVQLKVGPNKDRLLLKFSYIIGSKTGTQELTVIGQIVQRCFDPITALKGQVVKISNTQWEKRYGTLSHGQNTIIQAVSGHEDEFDEVDFQVEEVENIGNFKAWTRLSVIGCIRELQEPLPSERVTGQFYVDFFLQSLRGSAVAVRVSGGLSEMPLLEEDKEVFLKNFKVNADKEQLYGDLADLSDLCFGTDGTLYPVEVRQTITWQRL